MKASRRSAVLAVILANFAFLNTYLAAQETLLYSFEDDLEGWAVTGFNAKPTEVVQDVVGATDGASSASIIQSGDGFNWAIKSAIANGSDIYNAIQQAALNPNTNDFRFDVTYDTTLIPQDQVTFANWSFYINSSAGFQAAFNVVTNDGKTNGTFTGVVPLSSLLPIATDGATFYEIGFALNGNWGPGDATFFIDNIRLFETNAAAAADLDADGDVDLNDWTLFINGHKQDLSGLTQAERFAKGDLDNDGDNDFQDFVRFETVYDSVNGGGALRALAQGVPEPAGMAVCLIGLTGLIAARRYARSYRALQCGIVLSFACGATSVCHAQLLHSWENSLEGWVLTTFNDRPASIATSTSHPTLGTRSLALTQDADGFSWDTQVNYDSTTPQYQSIANAVAAGPENFVLEMDVTYDTSAIPQSQVSFMQVFFSINVDGNWSQVNNQAETDGRTNTTLTMSRPLSDWTTITSKLNPDNYQFNIGLNGNWGATPATIYFDNLRLRQVNFPDRLTLEVDRDTGATAIKNDSGRSIEFDYYEIVSASGSLNRAGWNSLDDQNISAVDGPDAGTVAGNSKLEGWDEAGGAGTNDLSEAFLLRSTTMTNGQMFNIGNAYNSVVDGADLFFRFRNPANRDRLVTGIVELIGGLECDLNGDNAVDAADMAISFSNWGRAGSGDLNGDNIIDAADAAICFGEWTGDSIPGGAQSVPEPIGWILWGAILSVKCRPLSPRAGRC